MKQSFTFLALILFVLGAVYFTSCDSTSSDAAVNNQEDSLKEVIARGEYLANHVAACIHCHSQRDFNKFSGPTIPGTEGGGGQQFDNSIVDFLPGTFYSKNITPDPETGIGNWTDEEVLRAMTQGIRKNGDTLFPLMPYPTLNQMAKDDLLAIIAYLRTLKPIKNQVPDRQMMIPISMAYPAEFLKPSVDDNKRPPKNDLVNYGHYMAEMADCAGCHTPFANGQPDMSRLLAGGNTFKMKTFKVNSANITADSATGIGAWSESAFLAKFAACRERSGYDYDPGKSNTIMPVVDYAGMTDDDLKAIYAYLRTIKPVNNLVVKYPE